MQKLGPHWYISWQELEELGVPKGTLDYGVNAAKGGHSTSWRSIADPADRRRVLVQLDSVPAQTRRKYGVPTVAQAEEQARLAREQAQEADQFELANRIEQALQQAAKRWQDWMPKYKDYPFQQAKDLAEAASVLAEALHLTDPATGERGAAQHCLVCIQDMGLRYLKLSNLPYFYTKLKKARSQGVTATVRPPREGNRNRVQFKAAHRYLAEYFYAAPEGLGIEKVWQWVRLACRENGLREPSLSWVKNHLNNPEVRNACMESRLGQRSWKQSVQGYTSRTMAASVGECWMEDGTKLMLTYRKPDGKPGWKWIYAVVDVFSGYVLGFSLGDSEDRWVRLAALKMAIQVAGHAPAELIHDRHSHSTTEEVQRMEQALQRAGVVVTPAPVGQPQYKSQVERFFNSFQQLALRGSPNFIGEGITSRNRHSRPNPEVLERLVREGRLPTEQALLKQVAELVAEYNQAPRYINSKERPAPNVLFNRGPRPYARAFGELEVATAFWPARTVTLRRSELRLVIRGEEFKYIPVGEGSADFCLRYNGAPLTVHYEPQDPSQAVYLSEPETGLHLGMAKLKRKVNGNRATQTEADRQELARQRGIQNQVAARRDQRNKRLLEQAEAEGLNAHTLEELRYENRLNKAVRDSAETASLMAYLRQEQDLDERAAEEGALQPVPASSVHSHAPGYESAHQRRRRRGLYDAEGSGEIID